jgi:uncharacterized membrane protein YuzA (DUF378 family)
VRLSGQSACAPARRPCGCRHHRPACSWTAPHQEAHGVCGLCVIFGSRPAVRALAYAHVSLSTVTCLLCLTDTLACRCTSTPAAQRACHRCSPFTSLPCSPGEQAGAARERRLLSCHVVELHLTRARLEDRAGARVLMHVAVPCGVHLPQHHSLSRQCCRSWYSLCRLSPCAIASAMPSPLILSVSANAELTRCYERRQLRRPHARAPSPMPAIGRERRAALCERAGRARHLILEEDALQGAAQVRREAHVAIQRVAVHAVGRRMAGACLRGAPLCTMRQSPCLAGMKDALSFLSRPIRRKCLRHTTGRAMIRNCTQNAHVSALTQAFNPVTCSAAPGSRQCLAISPKHGGRTGNQPRCAHAVCAAQDPQQPCILLGPRRKVHLCIQLHELDGPVRESVPARIMAFSAETVRPLRLPLSHPHCHILAPSLGVVHHPCMWSVSNRGQHFMIPAVAYLLIGRAVCWCLVPPG